MRLTLDVPARGGGHGHNGNSRRGHVHVIITPSNARPKQPVLQLSQEGDVVPQVAGRGGGGPCRVVLEMPEKTQEW